MLSLRAVNQFYGNQHTLWNVDLDLPQGGLKWLNCEQDLIGWL